MLMKGDLVRVPQNTHVTSLGSNSWQLHVTNKPQFAIILEVREQKCRILLNDAEWEVKSKDIRLYGDKDVCKAS